MDDRVVVVTGWGLLGQAIARVVRQRGDQVRVIGSSVADLPGRSWRVDLVESRLPDESVEGADLVIHTAALTSVVECERDPDRARRVNTAVTRAVAEVASEFDVPIAFASTDWVFDGVRGRYREGDAVRPVNVYGATKAAAEECVLDANGLVLRGAFVGGRPDGRVGLREALRGSATPAVARPRLNTPLWVGDYARDLLELVRARVRGVVHLGSATSVEWGVFCRRARSLLVGTSDVAPAPDDEVPRPHDSSLDTGKATMLLGRSMPEWEAVCATFAREEAMVADWDEGGDPRR
jgi:dTDP-4-dehydrorhamnose reductase